ncbi:polar amino acid transport system substrate-binding protein [Andreprevotia lacus DSM 23236]|jgi:polar amino acid transport system substrate-binding protein|uniref:Polar amino acid transport system substrate-binding protein n=1 Tax=Andreprevotia lacus DSM 23236 TaxID=1121001 RepID=A0A1W1Y080_9NEIS|nr:transporter substrate-binding domain-containing protein [Andreprevotia lacus]SMC29629.1 polar amino acid transport system substrate-binding protein [Andreprevotia lacus DSM 23236]
MACHHHIAALLLAATLAGAHAADCQRVIITAHPDYKPFHWYDGKAMTGASIELARRILDDMRFPYEIRYMGPWPRVLKEAEAGNVDIVMGLKSTPERREYMDFTSEPAFPNPMAVFVRKDKTFAFTRWDDLIGKRGGVNSGDRYGEGFDEFLHDKLNIEPVNEMGQNFKKLGADRIDYYITGLYPGMAYLADNKQDQQFVTLAKPINSGVVQVGFVKKSPCLVLLQGFNLRLQQLNAKGEPQKLLDKYLGKLRDAGKEGAAR